jgi:hypothetical protein
MIRAEGRKENTDCIAYVRMKEKYQVGSPGDVLAFKKGRELPLRATDLANQSWFETLSCLGREWSTLLYFRPSKQAAGVLRKYTILVGKKWTCCHCAPHCSPS